MASSEFEQNAERAMVACARHCCVCRRFRPTALQVHHVDEKAQGGTDDYDNLIPVCLTCHSDVHTRRPFARRFTQNELRQHRDQVYRMVAEGVLVPPEEPSPRPPLSVSRVQETVYESATRIGGDLEKLSLDAIRILVSMARGDGHLIFSSHMGGRDLRAGTLEEEVPHTNHRRGKEIDAAIDELERSRLITRTDHDRYARLYELTILGYTVADDLDTATD